MTYHSDKTRVSNSSLKLFARAPILWKRWRDGTLIERKSADLVFGSLLHCLQFEPDNFRALFATLPDDAPSKPNRTQLGALQKFGNLPKPTKAQIEANEKTTAALQWWNDWAESNEGKELVSVSDIADARACLAGLQADEKCREWLNLPGLSEVVIEWTDEATGIACKAKMDRITRHAILDLKSAKDASADGFRSAAFRYGYHRQSAWYLDGLATALKQGTLPPWVVETIGGEAPGLFVFPTVEKDDEHLAHCFISTPEFVQRGREENAALMKSLRECIATDTWPGLSQHESGMTPLELPTWTPSLETTENQ